MTFADSCLFVFKTGLGGAQFHEKDEEKAVARQERRATAATNQLLRSNPFQPKMR